MGRSANLTRLFAIARRYSCPVGVEWSQLSLPWGTRHSGDSDLSLWSVCTQLCGSRGLWALHVDKANYLLVFERERLVPT